MGIEIVKEYQLPNEECQLSRNENYNMWKIQITK
jgi:hypothetical protein